MMNESLFFRLLPVEDKAEALAQSVAAVLEGRNQNSIVHAVNPASFCQVPGSPFAYWVSERIRRLFTELPPFESDGRTVKVGLQTSDDFRFVRAWWEVAPERIVTGAMETTVDQFRQQTFAGKRWVSFAKGGEFSPYYADLHLVVNWERDGEEIRNFVDPESERAYSRPQNTDFYFRSGLTWPRRTNGLSFRILPAGCVFADKGPTAFVSKEDRNSLGALACVMNSVGFYAFVQMLIARVSLAQSFEVGLIQSIPIPEFSTSEELGLKALAMSCVNLMRTSDGEDATSHNYHLPVLLEETSETLKECITTSRIRFKEVKQQLARNQQEIDDDAFRLYGIEENARRVVEETVKAQSAVADEQNEESEDSKEAEQSPTDHRSLITDLLSYAIGCTFGRWDIRFATKEKPAPALPDPFAPLPACSPGMLTGEEGLPLRKTPPQYPLKIDWDGILVDDPDHADDLLRRAREVFEVIWKDRAEAIETEACKMLGLKELREYFRRPGNGGFWMDHVKRYSKSRRKAPIYWLLQSSKKNYSLWLYYHRLDKDILFKALVNYVEPKIRLEENRLAQLRSQRAQAGTAGREAKQLEKQLDRQESLLSDLHDFRDKLRRAADLHLEPNLDDGVVLNIAPLWELVPWPEAKKYWEELLAEKYEWSFIGKQLREKGLVKSNG